MSRINPETTIKITFSELIKESDSLLIQSINAECTIVETLEAMKLRKPRMFSECTVKLGKLVHYLEMKNKRTALTTYGFHRLAKLYLFTGAVTKKREYMDEAICMLQDRYGIIPDILMCESMHALSTRLLISGSLRSTEISGYCMDVFAIKSLVFKYCPVDDAYKIQIANIYRELAFAYFESQADKCNFEILSTQHIQKI